jgi:hypothetical protein
MNPKPDGIVRSCGLAERSKSLGTWLWKMCLVLCSIPLSASWLPGGEQLCFTTPFQHNKLKLLKIWAKINLSSSGINLPLSVTCHSDEKLTNMLSYLWLCYNFGKWVAGLWLSTYPLFFSYKHSPSLISSMLVSFPLLWQNTRENQLQWEKFYFGSQFQRFHSCPLGLWQGRTTW